MEHEESFGLNKVAKQALESLDTESVYQYTQRMRKKLLEGASMMDPKNPKAVSAITGLLNSMSDTAFKRDRGIREDKAVDSQEVIAEASSLIMEMYRNGSVPVNPNAKKPQEVDLGDDGDIKDWELDQRPNDEDLKGFQEKMGVANVE